MKLSEINSLKKKAKNLRIKTFIEFIKKGEAHLGGSFSMIEILLTLYEKVLKKNDKFVLSKSHSSFPLIVWIINIVGRLLFIFLLNALIRFLKECPFLTSTVLQLKA